MCDTWITCTARSNCGALLNTNKFWFFLQNSTCTWTVPQKFEHMSRKVFVLAHSNCMECFFHFAWGHAMSTILRMEKLGMKTCSNFFVLFSSNFLSYCCFVYLFQEAASQQSKNKQIKKKDRSTTKQDTKFWPRKSFHTFAYINIKLYNSIII